MAVRFGHTSPVRVPSRSLPDALFLAVAVMLSTVLYIDNLGFYTDDWYFFGQFSQSADRPLTEQLEPVHELKARPVQNLYLLSLYRIFGTNPLGYHVVAAFVFVVCALLFYGVLRELDLPSFVAVSGPLLFALLPQYSTVRFWITGNTAILSVALYFLSLYAGLRATRAGPRTAPRWMVLSIAGLVTSLLAYEMVLPLFVANIALVAWRAGLMRGGAKSDPSRTAAALFLAATGIALTAIVAFKIVSIDRSFGMVDYLGRLRYVLWSALSISYFGPNGYGLGLPRTVGVVLRDHPDALTLVAAGVFGLGTFLYLRRIARRDPRMASLSGTFGFGLAALGLATFLLGYAMALVTPEVGFSKTGLLNRTAIPAAAGVALSLIGGLIAVGSLARRGGKRIWLPLSVSILCAAGFLINNTLAAFWAKAHTRQTEVIGSLRNGFPTLPQGSAVIVDGACPYIGPGIVFESHWDTTGALRLAYGDRTLRGDVVTRNLTVGERGLETSIYGSPRHSKRVASKSGLAHCCQRYAYGENLFVYNASAGALLNLRDAASARRYFGNGKGDNGRCLGVEGTGVPAL